MPKYLIQITEVPNSGKFWRVQAGLNQVIIETPPKDHVASFEVDMTNVSRMNQMLTDINTAVTTAEGA